MTPGPEPRPMLPALLADSIGFLLAKATQRAAGLMDAALKPYGLKARHYGVLAVLRSGPPRSQQQVADLLTIDRTTMAAVVDDLERLELVRRRPSPGNRRAHELRLTEAGARRLDEMAAAVARADEELAAGLPGARRVELRGLLEALAAPLRAPDRNGA
jgi:DNA-binding MarR family transcriptional regulator